MVGEDEVVLKFVEVDPLDGPDFAGVGFDFGRVAKKVDKKLDSLLAAVGFALFSQPLSDDFVGPVILINLAAFFGDLELGGAEFFRQLS